MASHQTGPAKHQSVTTLRAHPELYPYVLQHINQDDAVSLKLRQQVESSDRAIMMGAPDEASFLAWLVALTGARKCLEIGTFRGTTALAIARHLPPVSTSC
jgi:predicted O-methyltransferase YrrM